MLTNIDMSTGVGILSFLATHERVKAGKNFIISAFYKQLKYHTQLSYNMGLVAKQPVFGVSAKASFKPVSSATEIS